MVNDYLLFYYAHLISISLSPRPEAPDTDPESDANHLYCPQLPDWYLSQP
jgi:hypothetical protein